MPGHMSCGGVPTPGLHAAVPVALPLWHAQQEATEALKPILGEYYRWDDRNVIRALWDEVSTCTYVAPDAGAKDSGVLWYKTAVEAAAAACWYPQWLKPKATAAKSE
jgi:hypothetical protein